MEGGSETTPSFLQSFVMMLVAFPDVQRKLHEEIDSVVGSDRVPRPDDFVKLVYLQVRLHVFALNSSLIVFFRLRSEKLTECDLSFPSGSLMELLRM
jgi:cytochrome P450